MAVVTSSVPVGGEAPRSRGAQGSERARSVDSASAGAPARTGRGRCALAGSRAGVAAARGAAAAFGFAAAFGLGLAAALGFRYAPVLAFARSPPTRVVRVEGRLPSTPASSLPAVVLRLVGLAVFSLIASDQSTFRHG